ncbi:hypothetical protein [Vibrio cincinnatiensis]|jgi:hypothetical protein|uniref:hypothetical protein n=1 Tax=Vibrio cincinnatiensis TaxID=675 RepID=UPI001302C2E4|nr:hypothetical protein [Vibrio cincinnatiensis]MCG3737975.1 hypothetical protein [Vibrio cincinnatiensis]MCG3748589.1 hypothetical protein [Vibrio cincinnatiensis]
MSIYQLKPDFERFKTFELDVVTLAEQLGNVELIDTLMGAPATSESLKTIWNDGVSFDFDGDSAQKNEPDITTWDVSFLVMSKQAYEVVRSELEKVGEFLPIEIGNKPFFVFHCLSFGLEDTGLTEMEYQGGYPIGLKSLAFVEPDIRFKAVFKSKLQGAGKLFATERLKKLCDENRLQGLRFDTDLVDPF